MTTIPQDLVESILADFNTVKDRNSLKAIALTATQFVGPAQRIIFRSLSLHGHDMPGWCPTFERALILLNGSPHLASYVKNLTIRLPHNASLAHHDLLEQVLPKFSNVRRLVLRGVGITWDDLKPGLQSTITTFLLQSSLEKLHLAHMVAVPLAVIAIAAQRFIVLSLHTVFISRGLRISLASSTSRLTHLILASSHPSQSNGYQNLISPAYIANLRRLGIEQSDLSRELLPAVGSTLTDLSLDCTRTSSAILAFRALTIFTLPNQTLITGSTSRPSPI